jgi:glycosyltransferase involved in cell wall biosynthesis
LQGEEKYLEKLIDRLGVKDNVQIVSGLLSREKLVEFVQMSDVIVLPFKLLQSETPLSVLEAMSLGKVVVTTRIRTLGEIVGKDRGVLIEASDSDQLEEAILQIVNGKIDSERIKANAREYVASMPTWTDVTERTISVLENAVL